MRIFLGILVFLGGWTTSFAACPIEKRIPGRYIIRHKTTQTLSGDFRFLRPEVKTLNSFQASELRKSPEVLSVENDCYVPRPTVSASAATPGENVEVKALIRWDAAMDYLGGPDLLVPVIVAVSDTGMDYNHPAFRGRLWENAREKSGLSGFDDDGNGCTDDFFGCDMADRDGDPGSSSEESIKHGTHVAGIINSNPEYTNGFAGIAPNARIVSVKGFPDYGDARLSDLLDTIYYSVSVGAKVINCSWGGGGEPTAAELEAFQFALDSGALPVIAAGNDGVDVSGSTPAGIPFVFTVGSISSAYGFSTFSNFGLGIDILAPGGDRIKDGSGFDEWILSTFPYGGSGTLRGTSMAAPVASAAAALIFGVRPDLGPRDVAEILRLGGSLRSLEINGSVQDYRILDTKFAVTEAASYHGTLKKPQDDGLRPPTNNSSGVGPSCGSLAVLPGIEKERLATPGTLFFFFIPLILWGILQRKP